VKAILLTSTFRRHVFVANALAQRCDVVGVWQEAKTFVPERYAQSDEDERVIQQHFADRDVSEERYFAADDRVRLSTAATHRVVDAGACSDPSEVARMSALQPDVVFVFGTGILRDTVLTALAGRLINLHLGLSPYYRGAGTNFWPLVNAEPEYVGATIHYLDAGIDSGAILAHARPAIAHEDGPHDLGNKTIAAAVDALVAAGAAHVAGAAAAVPQWSAGRLYQRKDFNADAVRQLYRNFAAGMIDAYLAMRSVRDAKLRLIAPERAA
jgi:methionyl-tRNA formyltransferase